MFSGQEFARFRSSLPTNKVYDMIEDALSTMGDASISKAGTITIEPRPSIANTFSKVTMDGGVRRKGNEDYAVTVDFTVSLNAMGWTVLIIGLLCALIGCFVLIAPYFAKEKVEQSVRRSLRTIEGIDD